MVRVNNNSTTPTSPTSALSPEAELSPDAGSFYQEDIEMEDNFHDEVNTMSHINLNDHEEPSVVANSVDSSTTPAAMAVPPVSTSSVVPSGSESNLRETVITPVTIKPTTIDQKDQDPVTSSKTTEELIAQYEIKIMRLRCDQLEMKSAKEIKEINDMITQFTIAVNNLKGINNIKTDKSHHTSNNNDAKKFAVPVFQLIDDPASTKSEGKPSYENAETFVTTFENVLFANDIDINKDWSKYLFNSFTFSKNDKYVKFYNNQLGSRKGKEQDWEYTKNKIIDRFGTSNNIVNNITSFIQIHQGKVELIRDYMDRYIDVQNKIPEESRSDNQYDAAKFVDSLVPDVKQEITKFLKRNKPKDSTSYLPGSLTSLFNTIEENIGEIQEALYITTKTPHQHSNQSNITTNKSTTHNKRERNTVANEYDNQISKKMKLENAQPINNPKTTNLCNYCNKVPYSYKHQTECIAYYHSDKYKQRVLQEKKGQKPHDNQQK